MTKAKPKPAPAPVAGLKPSLTGKKATRIVELINSDDVMTRKQIAEAVGCTVGRVGQIVRGLGLAERVPRTLKTTEAA